MKKLYKIKLLTYGGIYSTTFESTIYVSAHSIDDAFEYAHNVAEEQEEKFNKDTAIKETVEIGSIEYISPIYEIN